MRARTGIIQSRHLSCSSISPIRWSTMTDQLFTLPTPGVCTTERAKLANNIELTGLHSSCLGEYAQRTISNLYCGQEIKSKAGSVQCVNHITYMVYRLRLSIVQSYKTCTFLSQLSLYIGMFICIGFVIYI